MSISKAISRQVTGRYRRAAAKIFARRRFVINNSKPLISFSFDDFPRSALFNGGRVLERHGLAGTYYTSLGLMGRHTPTGEMFHRADLQILLGSGHELGCHTFAHCHASETPSDEFERSILDNRRALSEIDPTAAFKTLSYPIGNPLPETKRRCEKYFLGCRGGGQYYNSGTVDLNYLKAFFLEQSRHDLSIARNLIDANCRTCGWLIFATHDVCDNPTRFGCTPDHFFEVVDYAVQSGSRILPVAAALISLGVVSLAGSHPRGNL